MTGFTIKNTQVNSILLADPTAFTFRTVEGNEDTATIAALKEAFTKEDYTLNPNVATRNNFISYYNSFVSQIANSGDVYNSIAEAKKASGARKVSECCSGKRKMSGGFHWEYYTDEIIR